jgi:hypothetical protein
MKATNGHHLTRAVNAELGSIGADRLTSHKNQSKKRALKLFRYPACVFGSFLSLAIALNWIYILFLRPFLVHHILPYPTEASTFAIVVAFTACLSFWHFRKPKNI